MLTNGNLRKAQVHLQDNPVYVWCVRFAKTVQNKVAQYDHLLTSGPALNENAKAI